MNDRKFDRALRALARNGYIAGAAAGSWIIDGNTSEAEAAEWLIGIDLGDDRVVGQLPASPFSGEYADDPQPAEVLAEAGVRIDENDPGYSELLSAFEMGYSQGALEEVQWSAAAALSAEPKQVTRRLGLTPKRLDRLSDHQRVQRCARSFALEWYPVRSGRAALAQVSFELGGPRDPMGGRVNYDPERGA